MRTNKHTIAFTLAISYTFFHYLIISSLFKISCIEDAKNTFDILGVLIGVLSALLAVNTYQENSRQKSAELLISLESTFRERILPTLLSLEYAQTYRSIEKDLQIALGRAEFPTCANEVQSHLNTIKEIDSVFRFFHLCTTLRNLRIDQSALDQMLCYWLCVLNATEKKFMAARTKQPQSEQKPRADLTDYMHQFWPGVYKEANLLTQKTPETK